MSDQLQKQAFIKAASQSYSMEILLQQNAALEREVERLMAELDEVTMGIQMKGYLYKWRDREISFASKWGLRYFVLQKNTISYYIDDASHRPRRTIPLEHCIIKDEGLKRNGLYHVFSIYGVSSDDMNEDDEDQLIGSGNNNNDSNTSDMTDKTKKLETGTLILRLSSSNHGEAKLWIDMLQQACMLSFQSSQLQSSHVHTLPSTVNNTVTSYSELLSIPKSKPKLSEINNLQLPQDTLVVDTSIETWENNYLPESIDVFSPRMPADVPMITEEEVQLLSPMVLQRVKSSTEILKKSMSRPTLLIKHSGNASGSTTPNSHLEYRHEDKCIDRDSVSKTLDYKDNNLGQQNEGSFSTSNPNPNPTPIPLNKDASQMNRLVDKLFNLAKRMNIRTSSNSKTENNSSNKKSGYVPRSFPASKPMHLKNISSPLSSEVRTSEISYRGFFNLGVIIFLLTHFRLIVDNTIKYGILLNFPWSSLTPILGLSFLSESIMVTDDISTSYGINNNSDNINGNSNGGSMFSTWDSPQITASIVSWFVTILTSYGIEKVAAQGDIDEYLILFVNYIVGTLNLIVPCLWVWTSKSHPIPCMIYLFQSVVIWMKLISYAHVNRDLRIKYQQQRQNKGISSSTSTGSINSTTNLPTPVALSRSPSRTGTEAYQTKKSTLLNLFAEIENIEPPFLIYPNNISIKNLFYFCLAPTLCYQLNYPRTKIIKLQNIISILIRLGLCCSLILIVIEQYIRPILVSSLTDMKEANIGGIILRLLKLSIPSTYVWLLSFYIFFHLWLNLLAEITRFGDREFYKDWWNSRTIENYWRLWNLPVHHWMLRHLYYPLLRSGVSKSIATLAVFGFSALFHEVVISVPFRYFALHAFFGMLAQAPLVAISRYIDRRFDNPMLGNIMFWLLFCVIGQPMGVIMYYYDFWKISQ